MSSKSKSVVVGYKYFMGVHIALCHGPVDSIRRIIFGERLGWSGNITTSQTFSINNPDLFGGEKREGGVQGDVDVMMGELSQQPNGYLITHQGVNSPAYRGFTSLVFKDFMWSAMNPYFKAPWVEVTRILKGWSRGQPWNPSDAIINSLDMNPAHIIYECLTNLEWGMGYNTSDINEVNFAEKASTLKAEGFGLSLAWIEQSTIEQFIREILDHINGSLRTNALTGKFELQLIRDDYVLGDLTNLNLSNIIEITSFQRSAFGELANEVVLEYTDRNQKTVPITVQDLASIQAQGGVISTTKSYPGIRTAELAARVAVRDLNSLSTPLTRVSMTTNRILWDKGVGDAVSLTLPERGIELAAYRIIKINKGSLTSSKITVELAEDVFGLPQTVYTTGGTSLWSDPITGPVKVESAFAFEAPFWEINRTMSRADFEQLLPNYGFGVGLATKDKAVNSIGYSFASSPSNGGTFTNQYSGSYAPSGLLSAELSEIGTTFTLTNFHELDDVVLNSDDGYLMIDDEFMAVQSVNITTGFVTVRRGVLDTVPAKHLINSRAVFVSEFLAFDYTERVQGENTYYKHLSDTAIGSLAPGLADSKLVNFKSRATRPYPPGNMRINGSYFPSSIEADSITLTWAHRDRLAQTVDLVDFSQGNIGPETGTTYTIRLYKDATNQLLNTISGITGTSQTVSPVGGLYTMRVEIESVCNGLTSLYKQTHKFTFFKPLAIRITEDGNTRVTEDGNTRVRES